MNLFVTGTGRCGTTSMAHILSQHPDLDVIHERTPELIELSTRVAHGEVSDEETVDRLVEVYGPLRPGQGESNHRLWPLLPALRVAYQILDRPYGVVWMYRDARDFLASAEKRGWWEPEDTGIWGRHRPNGAGTGDIDPERWRGMSMFERLCWYWWRVNSTLLHEWRRDLDHVLPLALEKMGTPYLRPSVFEHFGLDTHDVETSRLNASAKTRDIREWSRPQQAAFRAWCSPLMYKLYGSQWKETA